MKSKNYNLLNVKNFKPGKKAISAVMLFIFISAGVFYQMIANTNGASSQTTAPGEVTCSQSGCHGAGNGEGSSGGLTDNTGGGSVVISGISGTYVPGTVYNLTVTVNQLGAQKFGFNAEALDASNGNAGTLAITLAGTWLRQGINGTRTTVSQGHSGSSGPTAGNGTDFFDFTFNWTAPASSVGPVTFYATGLAVNKNGLNDSGDEIYFSTLTVNPTTATSAQILLSRTTFNFPSFYSLANTVGNTQVFWTAGQGLSGNLTAAVVGAQFQIATTSGGPWGTSIPLTATSGVVSGTPIYVHYTGPASGTQTGTVTVSGGGATSKTIPLSGVVRTGGTAPSISTPTPTVINFGTVNVGSGNSVPQTFSVTTANPVGSYTITAPTGYEISFVPTYDYENVILGNFFGAGFTLTVNVRLKNPQAPGTISGNITVAMPGATTQSVSVTANAVVPAQWVLASSPYLSLFTTNPGNPSVTQTISVTGGGLSSTLDITAPTNFEVSLLPSSAFGAGLSITPVGGNVAPTTVYVRYNNPLPGLDAATVIVSSTGATSQNVNVNGDCFGSPMAINSIAKNETLTIYPNPSNGFVFIKTNESYQELFVSVSDISGKIVLSEKLNPNNRIDLSNHAGGIYFMSVVDINKNVLGIKKIILGK